MRLKDPFLSSNNFRLLFPPTREATKHATALLNGG